MTELITKVLLYIVRALCQAFNVPEDHGAKALIYAAFDTGVAPSILSGYLTERGQRYADSAADLAEEAKLAVQQVQADIEKDKQKLEPLAMDPQDPYP